MSGSRSSIVDTLNQFMRSSEWQESIQIFVEANCAHFKGDTSDGFTHEQFKIWKNFQDIVESILASGLDDAAGCSMTDFERELEELSREPASGPREGVKRELLSQLLTYSDFGDFASMMNVAVTYQYPEQAERAQQTLSEHSAASDAEVIRDDNREENRAVLLQLSFPREAVDHVIAASVADSSLDHLIDQLTNMQQSGSGKLQRPKSTDSDVSIVISPDNGDIGRNDQYFGNSFTDSSGVVNQEKLENECLGAFAQETLQDPGELRAKFVIALSILDSVDAGDMTDAVLEQLSWASSMCTLFQDMVTSFSSGVPFEQYNFSYARGLLSWFDELDKTFFSLKIGANSGAAMSEAELRRIVALEDLASMGTEDERLLHGLISRHEEVLKELSGLHGKCILMTSATTKGTRIKREHLEELYLYLKQQVNSGLDLSAVSDEMFGQVSQLVSADVSTDAVNLLLDIHVLEDEQILLKRQIMALVRDPSASKEDHPDDDVQEISLFGARSGTAAPEAAGHKDNAEFKSPERKAWTEDSANSLESSTLSAQSNPKYSLPPLVSPGKEYRGIRQEIKDKEEKEGLEAARLAKIRDMHRNGLKNLMNNLQDQKARAMRAMERRMARRRAGQSDGDGTDDIGKNTRNVMEGDVDCPDESGGEIDLDEFARIEEALVAGYKRRCVQETRLAGNNGGVLTSQLVEQAKENAAGELKRRHEEELKRLMEELAHGREKERNRIKDMLYSRRQQKGSAANSAALQAEEARLLKEFEKEFDSKEAAAIAETQRQACVALAAALTTQSGLGSPSTSAMDILCGGNILELIEEENGSSSPGKKKVNTGDDSYFDSPVGKGATDPSADDIEQWLFKLREYTSAYGAAGASLMSKAQSSAAQSGDAPNPALAPQVLRVVLNACEAQLQDEGANVLSFANGNKPKVENMDSIKARILDEFERSRLKSEIDRNMANEDRSSRLRRRREERGSRGRSDGNDIEVVGDSDAEEVDAQGILASAIDGLMDESTQDTMSSVVSVYDQSIPDYRKTGNRSNLRTAADKTEKEKMIAAEREHKKELTDDLYAQMAMRKGNLEERLRQKKAKAGTSLVADAKESASGGASVDGDGAKEDDEEKLKKLEMAFGLVTELVQGAHGDDLKKMDLDSLLGLIEHATKVKSGSAEAKQQSVAITTTTNIYREGYEDILKDIDTLLGSRGPGGLPVVDLNAEREQKLRYKQHMDGIMQSRAKTLSTEYNVEKEKYDLRMKIEQARQQQSLQRKLLERRQSNANRPVASTGGAGYSSVAAGTLLAGMMSHADRSKNGASPTKAPIPESASALKSRGLSMNNLYRK